MNWLELFQMMDKKWSEWGWTPKIMGKTNEMNKCEKELNLAIRHEPNYIRW